MNYPYIASHVLGSPLMLARHKLNTILSVLAPRLDQDGIVLDGEYLPKGISHAAGHTNLFEKQTGIAVISIHGSLVHRSMGLEPLSGLTSYAKIEEQFIAALESDASEIVLDIDSPGGEVNGVFDLADRIYEARNIKPITALINESGFSGAYALASAAHKIIVPRTAGVGSIGVIAAHIDQSEKDKQNGLNVTTVFAGERKNDLNPHEPLDDEALVQLQQQVNETYDLFIDTVARNRGLSTAVIRNTQAGLFFGQHAVKAGLADTVSSIHHAISSITHEVTTMTHKASKPETEISTETPSIKPEVSIETTLEKPLDLNALRQQVEQELTPKLTETLSHNILQAERTRVTTVLEACATMNKQHMAKQYIGEGLSVEEASHKILNAMAADSDHAQITSTVTPFQNGEQENPLVLDAQRRAQSSIA